MNKINGNKIEILSQKVDSQEKFDNSVFNHTPYFNTQINCDLHQSVLFFIPHIFIVTGAVNQTKIHYLRGFARLSFHASLTELTYFYLNDLKRYWLFIWQVEKTKNRNGLLIMSKFLFYKLSTILLRNCSFLK